MNLFEGLESLGFDGLGETDIFKKKEKEVNKKGEPINKEDPMDYLYSKEFSCPVCDRVFINFIVRKSKLKLVGMESDLKPNYQTIDPNRYDVLLCDHCGYASLLSGFARISDKQIDLVQKTITPRFTSKEYPIPLSAEDAVERYKLALLNAVTKGVKASEKAILCLKIAWLYRDLNNEDNEQLFLRNALAGLKEAYTSESFPIGSMDENTTEYVIGELARRTGERSEAMRWISALIVKKNLQKGLRERAMNIKELLRAEANK